MMERMKNVERKRKNGEKIFSSEQKRWYNKEKLYSTRPERVFVIFFPQLLQRNYDEIEFDRSSSRSNNFRKKWLIQRFQLVNSFGVNGRKGKTASSENIYEMMLIGIKWEKYRERSLFLLPEKNFSKGFEEKKELKTRRKLQHKTFQVQWKSFWSSSLHFLWLQV